MNIKSNFSKWLSNLRSGLDKSNINNKKKLPINPINIITLFGFTCLFSAAIFIDPVPDSERINNKPFENQSATLENPPPTNFSRRFNFASPGKDSLTYDTNEIYKTSFIKEKILYLFNDANVVAVNIGTVTFPGKQYYLIMHGINNDRQVIKTICGDYPCPEDCLPPDSIYFVENRDNLFDRADIDTILHSNLYINYLNVHTGIRFDNVTNDSIFTYMIYGVTGIYNPMNAGNTQALVGSTNKVYTSEVYQPILE